MTRMLKAPPLATFANREDLVLIAGLVEPGSRVLDVGCGDGALLELLTTSRNVDARGLELSQAGVNACVARGLSVIQGDADADLLDYPDGAFDYVVLSQTIQATRAPRRVLDELLRIGQRVIVSFPNFGFWKVRLAFLAQGRMPVTGVLDHPWYDTPNIHLCTITDFVVLCREMGVTIDKAFARRRGKKPVPFGKTLRLANFFAEEAIFLLKRRGRPYSA